MALDTSRERLERLYQRSGDRRLWGVTWVRFVSREPHRVIVQSQPRRRGLVNLLVAVAAIGLFGLYPAIGSFSLGSFSPRLGWKEPGSCDGLRYRYELARELVGTPGFDKAAADFTRTRSSCEQHAATLPSIARADACQGAVRTYVRALGRASGRGPASLDAPWVVEITRDRTREVERVLGLGDLEGEERLAAAYLEACEG